MKRLRSVLLLSCLGLSACQWFSNHRINVQQGNVINESRVAQIHKGMSRRQVLEILGSPVYDNTFDDDRWVYIQTHQKGNRPMQKRQVIVIFRGERVQAIKK